MPIDDEGALEPGYGELLWTPDQARPRRGSGTGRWPIPDVRWFDGATLNYARNALRTARTDPGRTAIIFNNEDTPGGTLT